MTRPERGLMGQGRLVAVVAFVLLAFGALKDNYPALLGTTDIDLAKLDPGIVDKYVRINCDEVTALGEIARGMTPGGAFRCKQGDHAIVLVAPLDAKLDKQVEGKLYLFAGNTIRWPIETPALDAVRNATTMYIDVQGHTKALVLAMLGCLSALVALGLGAYFLHQQTKRVA